MKIDSMIWEIRGDNVSSVKNNLTAGKTAACACTFISKLSNMVSSEADRR